MDNSHETIGDAYSVAIRRIKLGEYVPEHEVSLGAFQLAGTKEGSQTTAESKRHLNSASMSVLCRRIVATEWMRALSKAMPDGYVIFRRRRPGVRGMSGVNRNG